MVSVDKKGWLGGHLVGGLDLDPTVVSETLTSASAVQPRPVWRVLDVKASCTCLLHGVGLVLIACQSVCYCLEMEWKMCMKAAIHFTGGMREHNGSP